MIQSQTLDEALVEAARFIKAAKALRLARKARDLGDMYTGVAGLQPLESVEHATALRASMDLTRKLANLRAGR